MNAIPSAVAVWTSRITTRAPSISTLAGVGLLDAADDLHQRRLAGAVLAEQRDDLSGVHVEAHAAQRVNARKTLVDAAKLKDRTLISSPARAPQRPRSCASVVLKSSTLFCRMTIVGMNNWWLAGMPDRSPFRAFASSVIDW